MPMRTPSLGPLVLRGAEVFAAAVVLLLLTQINSAVVKTGLLMAGLRTDAQAIATISYQNDPRGRASCAPPHRVRIGVEMVPSEPACGPTASVTSVVPSGVAIQLVVNGKRTREVRDSGPLVRFDGVQLRSGENSIAVVRAQGGSDYDERTPINRSWWSTRLGEIPEIGPTHSLRVTRPFPNDKPVRLGDWHTSQGDLDLWQSTPDSWADLGSGRATVRVGADGLAVVPAAVGEGAWVPQIPPLNFSRLVEISRDDDGSIAVKGHACLPPTNALTMWALASEISAPEFLERSTGIEVTSLTGLRRDEQLVVGASQADCIPIQFGYVVEDAFVTPLGHDSTFLNLPSDNLVLKGFPPGVVQGGAFPERHNDVMEWKGRVQPTPLRAPLSLFLAPSPLRLPSNVVSGDASVQRGDIAAALYNAFTQVPLWLKIALWGLAAAIPSLAVLLTLRRHRNQALNSDQVQGGLLALLAFSLAVVGQPLLTATATWITQALDMAMLFWERGPSGVYLVGSPSGYAPLAIAAALFILPAMRASPHGTVQRTHLVSRTFAAIVSIALLAAGAAVLIAQRLPWALQQASSPGLFDTLANQKLVTTPDQVLWMSAIWTATGVVILWASVYWLFCAALPRGRIAGAAFGSSLLIFYLPLAGYFFEAIHLILALRLPTHSANQVDYRWGFASAFASALTVVVVVVVLLAALRAVVMAMLDAGASARLQRWLSLKYLILVALILATPQLAQLAADPAIASSSVVNIVVVFQELATMIALLAAVSALVAAERASSSASRGESRDLDRFEVDVLAAVFAGFLTNWSHDPIALLLCAAAGWWGFKRFVVWRAPVSKHWPLDIDLGRRLVEFRKRQQLMEARRKTLEEQYSKATIDNATLDAEQQKLDGQAHVAQHALGRRPDVAKRMIFAAGPSGGRLRNGLRGAVAGLAFAALLQIAPFLKADLKPAANKTIQLLAEALLTNTVYSPMAASKYTAVRATEIPTPGLLLAILSLVDACALWLILGFVFGFAFDRIRGGDGLSKSLRLSAVIAAIFLMSELLSGVQGPMGGLSNLSPLVAFLLLTGVLVFDARSLQARGVAITELPALYGVRRSFGYASLIGLIGAAQPIMALFAKLFPFGK